MSTFYKRACQTACTITECHSLSSTIAGGQNGTLPVVGGLDATESSPWDLETHHPTVGSLHVAGSQEPHHSSQTSPTAGQTVP